MNPKLELTVLFAAHALQGMLAGKTAPGDCSLYEAAWVHAGVMMEKMPEALQARLNDDARRWANDDSSSVASSLAEILHLLQNRM
jgi:hypothetical protein